MTHPAKVYSRSIVRQAFYLTLMGARDIDLANAFGVEKITIDKWKHTHPEFLTAIRRGKSRADARVAHSLYKMSLGYDYTEEHVLTNRVRERNEKGRIVKEYTEPLVVKVNKHMPPNVKAAIKWLSARQPEIWGTKLQVDGKVNVNHKLDFSDFSTEELQVLKKLGIQAHDDNIEDVECEQE